MDNYRQLQESYKAFIKTPLYQHLKDSVDKEVDRLCTKALAEEDPNKAYGLLKTAYGCKIIIKQIEALAITIRE